MKYPMYAIKDRHSGFNAPTTDLNDNTAKRNFAQAINNAGNVMNFEPSDFDLFKIGYFDTDSGVIDKLGIPELVVTGLSVFGAKT